jgi:hypothetical protein
MLGLAAIGALSVIAGADAIGMALPQATPTNEVLMRTAPDIRDLGIAILSGLAGAFGSHRREYSSVLAGFAIAVALAPPLCAVGLMLEEGRLILAHGAFLLFLTNFVGVVLATVLTTFDGCIAWWRAPELVCRRRRRFPGRHGRCPGAACFQLRDLRRRPTGPKGRFTRSRPICC